MVIVQAIVYQPGVTLCDEPASTRDHRTGHRVMEPLRQAAIGTDPALVVVLHRFRYNQALVASRAGSNFHQVWFKPPCEAPPFTNHPAIRDGTAALFERVSRPQIDPMM